jgi:hypothetical protein
MRTRYILVSVMAVLVSSASAQAADQAHSDALRVAGKPTPRISAPTAINNQTAVACNVCFTCGGDWPVFAGSISLLPSGSTPSERGSSCSGSLSARSDRSPFLCCR